mgnify:CR=1 FL=1
MLIIGIAGGTGCGKTTVVNQILKELPEGEVGVISQDSYYKDTSHLTYEERVKINFDHPRSIDFDLLEEHLKELKKGKPIHQPVYSFVKHNRTGDTILTHPRKVMIVEGILILSKPKIRNMFDIKIFVDTPLDICLLRRMKRDIAERGRTLESVANQYESTVKPMYHQFISPSRFTADVIVTQGGKNRIALDVIKSHIQQSLL